MTNYPKPTIGSVLDRLVQSLTYAQKFWAIDNATATRRKLDVWASMAEDRVSNLVRLPAMEAIEKAEPVRRCTDAVTWKRILDELTQEAVDADRADGASWQQIGAVFGITRQAAQQRYGRRVR